MNALRGPIIVFVILGSADLSSFVAKTKGDLKCKAGVYLFLYINQIGQNIYSRNRSISIYSPLPSPSPTKSTV